MIQEQVKLPMSLAFGVVIQGIRIRFGRSLVTIGGVVLGIAFLMSSLTGQAVKRAVQGEEQLRTEVRRLSGFLAAEMGPPRDRVIGIIQTGALEEAETRLLQTLIDGGLRGLRWHRVSEDLPMPRLSGLSPTLVGLNETGRDASSVIVMGAGELRVEPGRIASILEGSQERILAFTRPRPELEVAGVSVVPLARELSPEEVAKAAKDARNARFRKMWIVIISLVVTIAGISNAMLMSVMERFREIGTMKCLGALSSFIRRLFLIEAGLMGAAGGVAGACLGALFPLAAYGFMYGFGTVLTSLDYAALGAYLALSVATGVVLSIVAAIYPAGVAARMVPAHALASNV